MSFRRRDVAEHGFDERLRGRGVEVHSELSICLPLRRRGQRLVYDPAIVVHHFPQARGFGDEREEVSREAIHDAAHNEALQLLDYFGPPRRLVFGVWSSPSGPPALRASRCSRATSSPAGRMRWRPSARPSRVASRRGELDKRTVNPARHRMKTGGPSHFIRRSDMALLERIPFNVPEVHGAESDHVRTANGAGSAVGQPCLRPRVPGVARTSAPARAAGS